MQEARLWTNEYRHELWGDSDLAQHVFVGHRWGGRQGRNGLANEPQ